MEVSQSGFPVRTALSPVITQPAQIHVVPENIAAWWTPEGQSPGIYPTVLQGTGRVGMVKLRMWTDVFTGILRSIDLTDTGTGPDSDVKSIRLYLDQDSFNNPLNGNGNFESGIDRQVTDIFTPPVFSTASQGSASLILKDPFTNGIVDTSTRTFYIVYEYAPTAIANATHRISLNVNKFATYSGDIVPFDAFNSTEVLTQATANRVQLTAVNDGGSQGLFKISPSVTQNDKTRVAMKLSLLTLSGSAIWQGLRIHSWFLDANTEKRHTVNDVSDVRLWTDRNGDGLFDETIDAPPVASVNNKRPFPQSKLTAAIDASTTVIRVADLPGLYPQEEDMFPKAPIRLVLNDGQIVENRKEVVVCGGLEQNQNYFTGCQRGREGTAAQAYSSGAVVSAELRLRLVGLGGGYQLDTSAKVFFITFDIASLANVDNNARLGVYISSAADFAIESPKTMDSANIGTPDKGGRTVSFEMTNVKEYADNVIVEAADSDPSSFLRQSASSMTLANFTIRTDVAEAVWRWVDVRAAGTALTEGGAGNLPNQIPKVSLWFDADNNGILDDLAKTDPLTKIGANNLLKDILVGTGTFGNSGEGGLAHVTLFEPQKLITRDAATRVSPNVSQRYFITLDVAPLAVPNRTIGVELDQASFKQGSLPPNVDDPVANSLSTPNKLASTSLTPKFGSALRTIIPAPQQVIVQAEPVFSYKDAIGNFQRIILTTDTRRDDSSLLVNSVLGLPSTGYAVLDNEIVYYDGLSLTNIALLNVARGQLSTLPDVHAAGTVLGSQVFQGDRGIAVFKLTALVANNGFDVQWSTLSISRRTLPGIRGYDADALSVQLWKDNGEGTFNRNLQGVNAADTLLGSAQFGGSEGPGAASIPIKDPTNPAGYTLIRSTPAVFFVVLNVSPSSNFSHPQLPEPNDVLALKFFAGTDFGVGPKIASHTVVLNGSSGPNDVEHPGFVVRPTINRLRVQFKDVAPTQIKQDSKNVGILRVQVETDQNSVAWEELTVERTGTGFDSEIDLVKLFADANNNQNFDDDVQASLGVYPNLRSEGTEIFSGGKVTLRLNPPVLATPDPQYFFITYDISQFAQVGATHGLKFSDTNQFKVKVPGEVQFVVSNATTSAYSTKRVEVLEASSTVKVGFKDLALLYIDEGGVEQARKDVPVLMFNLKTDSATAVWTDLQVRRAGGSQDTTRPFGRNTDVRFIRVYKDINSNDRFDVDDANLSQVGTQLAGSLGVLQPPFNLLVNSTNTFPSSGQIFIRDAELMSYSGSGFDLASGKPYLRIISRGDTLGQGATPVISHPAGSPVVKVDLFDQANDAVRTRAIQLTVPQLIAPSPQTYFVTYDIAETADVTNNNQVSIEIADRSWIGVSALNDVSPRYNFDISRTFPDGLVAGGLEFPYTGQKIVIKSIVMEVSGFSVAPAAAKIGSAAVPFLQLALNTNKNAAVVGALALTQTGTVAVSTTANRGMGDLTQLAVWLDDGDGAFNTDFDAKLGTTTAFSAAGSQGSLVVMSTVTLTKDGIPGIKVTTAPVTLFVSANAGVVDASGETTVSHNVGLTLLNFANILDVQLKPLRLQNSLDSGKRPPVASAKIQIAPAVIAAVSLIRPITVAPNGYPAFVLLDVSNNVMRDALNRPIVDQTKWVLVKGEPLIDLNQDGLFDNMDFAGTGLRKEIDLNGDGNPDMDIDGDGILDVDLNQDGVPDKILDNGEGQPLMFLTDENGDDTPMSDQGFAVSAWNKNTNSLVARWPLAAGTTGFYQVGAGDSYDDPIGQSKAWITIGVASPGTGTSGLARMARVRPSAGSEVVISSAALKNLALPVPKVTRLTKKMGPNDAVAEVLSTSGFPDAGKKLYIGSEIMTILGKTGTTFTVARGKFGSTPQVHLPNEAVSDNATIFSVRIVDFEADGSTTTVSPQRPLLVYRVDSSAPSLTGKPIPQVPPGQPAGPTFQINWSPSADLESDVASYEIQEQVGNSPIWKTIAFIPAKRTGGVSNSFYQVGNTNLPGESPRRSGEFYTYRVRAHNFAGVASDWSPSSTPAGTTSIGEVISKVSNYPNPVDLRKGGPAGKTVITYVLNADAEVKMSIFDLLGYVVREFSFSPGSEGGRFGPNFVEWDGSNAMGAKVSKGGYIVRIQVKSPAGTATAIRKVGVIH